MKFKHICFLVLLVTVSFNAEAQEPKQHFDPTFASLEKAKTDPEWFKDAKFGIYFHWGVYSVPAFANEWYPRNMFVKEAINVFLNPLESLNTALQRRENTTAMMLCAQKA